MKGIRLESKAATMTNDQAMVGPCGKKRIIESRMWLWFPSRSLRLQKVCENDCYEIFPAVGYDALCPKEQSQKLKCDSCPKPYLNIALFDL